MIKFLLKIVPFLFGQLGKDSAAPSSQGEKYLYMRRASFVLAVFFMGWALFFPASLSARIYAAADAFEPWFFELMAGIFAGVWL